MRLAIILLVSSLAAWGQLQVVMLDGTTERPLAATMDLGSTPIGSINLTTFVVRNLGTTDVVVSVIGLSGQGFSLSSTPSLPMTLRGTSGPTGQTRFEIRFAPTGAGAYSASLRVNTTSTILRASALAEARVAFDENGARVAVPVGGRINLGSTETGSTIRRSIFVENPYETPVVFRGARLTAAGSGFTIASTPTVTEIAPAGSLELRIDFAPDRVGFYQTPIEVNGRSYILAGAGLEIPLPKPSMRVEGSTASAQQPKVVIRLAETSRVSATGLLLLEFRPAMANGVDDPGVRFMAAGGRQLGLKVNPGDQLATVGSQPDAVFQTGTTAGTITFTLTLGPHREVISVEVPRAPVKLDTVTAVRRVNDIDLNFIGFDNARSVTQALFTFFDTTGRPVSPGTIRADLTADFERFFSGSRTGGTFLLRATFPVTGPAQQILEVEAELVNSSGGVKTERLKISDRP